MTLVEIQTRIVVGHGVAHPFAIEHLMDAHSPAVTAGKRVGPNGTLSGAVISEMSR
jgi:hypothetical protein